MPCVRDQEQHNAICHAKRLPTNLASLYPVLARNMQGIIEHELSRLKTDPSFCRFAWLFFSSQLINIEHLRV
jgi:hypothetical protein